MICSPSYLGPCEGPPLPICGSPIEPRGQIASLVWLSSLPQFPMWHRRWVESQKACLGQPHTLSGSRWPYSWSRGWNTQPGWPHGGCTRDLEWAIAIESQEEKKLSILKCSILIEHLRYSDINWSGENSHWKDSLLLPVPMRRLLAMPLGAIQKATRVVSKKRGRGLWTRTFVVVSVGRNRIC